MKETLEEAFAKHMANVQFRQRGLGPDSKIQIQIPILAGSSGIGKTSCVKEFSSEKGFQLIQLDCSYEPANFLAFRIANAIADIRRDEINGCVLLVNYIDEADGEWRELLDQYSHNRMLCDADVASEGKKIKWEIAFDQIPAQVFIVGESQSDN